MADSVDARISPARAGGKHSVLAEVVLATGELELRGPCLFAGVVGAADERAGFDVGEAEGEGVLL